MKTADYLAAVKAKLSITSDYALAKALGVPRQRISHYAVGNGLPSTLVCFKIAEILGEQPAGVIAEIELERAELMSKEEDIAAWKDRLRRWGGTAAGILLAALMGWSANPGAASAADSHSDASIHRMKRPKAKRRRRAGPWDGLLAVAL